VRDSFQYGDQAWTWEDGHIARSPLLPGGAMDAGDMNASGQVVGRSTRYPTEPYLWSQAEGLVPLGTLGGDSGETVAVNDAGQVLGWSQVDGIDSRAFLWEDGVMTDLGALAGGSSSVAGRRSLSEAGHVVGTSYSGVGGTHAFLWHEGEMTDLGTLGGAESRPVAVNRHGQVIGVSHLEDGGQAMFLWDDGVMTNLSAIAAGVVMPVDINDAGQAIGYDPSTGRAVVFTATPD
jgi:probable HAF family extracellular repeat protein